MLMQNFGVTKEYYGMLWYFLEWSIARSCPHSNEKFVETKKVFGTKATIAHSDGTDSIYNPVDSLLFLYLFLFPQGRAYKTVLDSGFFVGGTWM